MIQQHKAHGFMPHSMWAAIGNVDKVRDMLMEADESNTHFETELLYHLKSFLMELDQYFGGGNLSAEFIKEKCDYMVRYAENIEKEVWP
jgi:hypothetical protein